MISQKEFKSRLELTLVDKIRYSKIKIIEWYEYWDGKVYVAFSGGKDSTVLLDLVRSMYPNVVAVFHNTGLEFPEIIRFVKTIENAIILKPKKTFRWILDQKGYPIVSKRIAQYVSQVQNTKGFTNIRRLRLTGITKNGMYRPISKISNKWQYLISAPFKISDKCCYYMKKKPAIDYAKNTGRYPITGVMASEGKNRELTYLRYGCNAFDLSTQPRSNPISIWTEKDIWAYIKNRNLKYSDIYNKGYKRTGCIFCGFGVHLEKEPNRFQRLKITHNKLYNYCMQKLNMQEVLDYYGVSY